MQSGGDVAAAKQTSVHHLGRVPAGHSAEQPSLQPKPLTKLFCFAACEHGTHAAGAQVLRMCVRERECMACVCCCIVEGEFSK